MQDHARAVVPGAAGKEGVMIVLTVFAVCMLFHAAVVRHVTDATPRPRLAAVGGSTPAAFSVESSRAA